MNKVLTILSVLIAGFAALVWTGPGETSDPVLAVRELPADVANANDCAPAAGWEACHEPEFNRRWVGKTARGDLFVVTDEQCVGNGCRAWLVEKTAASAFTLLAFEKTFRLQPVAGDYPAVETYSELSPTQGVYSRFEWNGAAYARTANRLVYRVDDKECGTREECSVAAQDALRQRQVDRAVKIWENVYGVSWI